MGEAPAFAGFPSAEPFVLVVSGPSGAGKTVICRHLLEGDPTLVLSVSATTRPPRAQERNGADYHFWSEAEFLAAVERGHFLEWAMVHGHRYGTPRAPLEESLRRGRFPLLDVDVQGGRSVKALMPQAVLVMVGPPSMTVLESRLRGRRTDPEDVIQQRLARASRELADWPHYDYVVVNDRLEEAVASVRAILAGERARTSRRRAP